jgi:carbon-monoxide dehydrogenase medium subunit
LKLSGNYTVPIERERAYRLMQDPAVLARAMPGCDHLALIAPDEYEMRMKMVFSSIQRGLFAGKVRMASARGERTVSIGDFLVDTFTTALEPGEIVTEVIVPVEVSGSGVSYQKMHQLASGFAMVGAAVRVARGNGGIGFVRVGITGLASKAYRATKVESILESTGDVDKAAAAVADGVEANSDLNASAHYRSQMARVYTARALQQALARAS